MLMRIQHLVKFCLLVLKILSGNENYDRMTELQKDDRMTELQKDRQGKSSVAPTFSKRGYYYDPELTLTYFLASSNFAI